MTFQLISSVFEPGQQIPKKYTAEGEDVSPPLAWRDPPAGTAEFALIVDDPDAPQEQPWVHWVVYRIAAHTTAIREGEHGGGVEGLNDFGNTRWGGPKPPPGHGTHHYHFKLYALRESIDLDPGATKEQLLAELRGKSLGEAELVGTYERPSAKAVGR